MSSIIVKNRVEIQTELAHRKFENPELLKDIESVIQKNRGYIYKLPLKGSSVVSSLSGGADSTVTVAILLEEFGLDVYPYFVKRSQRNSGEEWKSVEYFSNFFKKRYPDQYHDPLVMEVPNPASEIKHLLTHELLGNVGHPMRNSIIMGYGTQYAFALSAKGVKVRDIFCSFVSSDGDYLYHSTLTAMRSLMLHTCVDMGDFSWQITSLALERELGYYFDKDVLVKWAYEHDIPLEKTWTCYENASVHCGVCEACYDRKRSFEEANVPDKTKYRNKITSKEILNLNKDSKVY